ncbi:alpha/beta fold hydrolase [Phaeobacter inhibens]|uniref:alpha/beta fold hydrolase n=2 Tax=Phaeobacter inhibens TaxID=221822 RepID=UPI000425BEFA|nr:alpha/beta hydrolase [Phaeobacter inhibens]
MHGYLGGATQWQSEIDAFSSEYVIAPNLPGFGAATGLPGCSTIAAMAEAALGLLNGLDVSDFILMSHSMDGMIAQEMAAARPAAGSPNSYPMILGALINPQNGESGFKTFPMQRLAERKTTCGKTSGTGNTRS